MPVLQTKHFEIVTVYEQLPNPEPCYSVKVRRQGPLTFAHLSLRNDTMRELRDALNRALDAEGAASEPEPVGALKEDE